MAKLKITGETPGVRSNKRRREEREEEKKRRKRRKKEKEEREEKEKRSWNIMEHHGTSWIIVELRIEN